MRFERFVVAALMALTLVACSTGEMDAGKKDAGGGAGGNGGSGGALAPFGITTLDSQQTDPNAIGMAVSATQQRVGVAYFQKLSTTTTQGDGGLAADYNLTYIEWKDGVVGSPEVIDKVQRIYGVSVAFQTSGEPAIAYLGGMAQASAFWFQNDLLIAYRNGGTWTKQTVTTQGSDCPCPQAMTASRGFLVGLFPSLAFSGTTAFVSYRDGHDGQFPQQDWAGSDAKLSQGGPTAWTHSCVRTGLDNKQAYGTRTSLVVANGQPAFVHDQAFGGADALGQNVLFERRQADGGWGPPRTLLSISNVQTGASLAYDPTEGYGVAAVDRSENKLVYTHSIDGTTFTTADQVFQSGSGGWFPSLAMDPINHEPAIAYYFCTPRPDGTEGSCPATDDELRVTQRSGGNWHETVVTTEGVYSPRLGFLSSGKRVVAYRAQPKGELRLAVER